MSKPDGGPAYPYPDYAHADPSDNKPAWVRGGVSLRDYFAAKAMQSYLRGWPTAIEANAARAYSLADAMIEERDK